MLHGQSQLDCSPLLFRKIAAYTVRMGDERSESFKSLSDLIHYGDPLPLSWAVEHGDAFRKDWLKSKDPAVLLWIAGHVISSEKVVTVTVIIARMMLPHVAPENFWLFDRMIENAEKWTRGEVTSEDLKFFTDHAWFKRKNQSENQAENVILNSVWASVSGTSPNASAAARDAAEVLGTTPSGTKRIKAKLARLVRQHIHVTVSDLARASKSGWSP